MLTKRARWDTRHPPCGGLLAKASGKLPEDKLDRLDAAQEEDHPSLSFSSLHEKLRR